MVYVSRTIVDSRYSRSHQPTDYFSTEKSTNNQKYVTL